MAGYLIINREVVSEDVGDFEYTPMPKYPGPFQVRPSADCVHKRRRFQACLTLPALTAPGINRQVFNEANEEAMLRKFIEHVQELRPHVIVTYNGDFFDWPYIDARCKKHPSIGSLYHSLGIKSSASPSAGAAAGARMEAEYTGRCCVHLDAFCWVKRDSYLPQVTNCVSVLRMYVPRAHVPCGCVFAGEPRPQGRDQEQAGLRPRRGAMVGPTLASTTSDVPTPPDPPTHHTS